MSYLNDPNTHILATHCVMCNLPLRDAESVEMGMGPVCRKKHVNRQLGSVSEENRKAANKAIHRAGVAAKAHRDRRDAAHVATILASADEVEGYGLTKLAAKIRARYIEIKVWKDPAAPRTRWDPRAKQEVRLEGTKPVICIQIPYSQSANSNRRRFLHRPRPVKDPDVGFFWQVEESDQRNAFMWLVKNFGGGFGATVKDGEYKVFPIPTWDEACAKYTTDRKGYWVLRHPDNTSKEAV